MTTTTTDQGVKCGNHGFGAKVYHPTTADVKACYQGNLAASRMGRSPSEWPENASPTRSSQTPRNAEEARNAAMQRLANQTSERPSFPASAKQISFATDLINELFMESIRPKALAALHAADSAKARQMITDLLSLRAARQQGQPEAAPAVTPRSASATLIQQVMGQTTEGNFAIIDEDGKARFYRISKRGKQSRRPGTWKIQERVTDMLLPRYDSMLGKVCEAIMAQGGPEAAGLRWAQLMHKCYKCGTSLTDTTGNPYYHLGLGPECGAK
jgi:hypothetical protein